MHTMRQMALRGVQCARALLASRVCVRISLFLSDCLFGATSTICANVRVCFNCAVISEQRIVKTSACVYKYVRC